MSIAQGTVRRRGVWDPLGYSMVLLVAWFSMLLCWDLLKNNGLMFEAVLTSVWSLGFLTTCIAIHAIVQTTYRQLNAAFSAMLGTMLCIALVVLSFSYVYGANGVCSAGASYADCIYYSVGVISALAVTPEATSSTLVLFTAWQAILGIFVFLVLVSQMISFTQEYKRIKRIAQPV